MLNKTDTNRTRKMMRELDKYYLRFAHPEEFEYDSDHTEQFKTIDYSGQRSRCAICGSLKVVSWWDLEYYLRVAYCKRHNDYLTFTQHLTYTNLKARKLLLKEQYVR